MSEYRRRRKSHFPPLARKLNRFQTREPTHYTCVCVHMMWRWRGTTGALKYAISPARYSSNFVNWSSGEFAFESIFFFPLPLECRTVTTTCIMFLYRGKSTANVFSNNPPPLCACVCVYCMSESHKTILGFQKNIHILFIIKIPRNVNSSRRRVLCINLRNFFIYFPRPTP